MITRFFERPLAITDLETSGDVPSIHEILEVGLVLVDPDTFAVTQTFGVKVRPEHIESAVSAALERNGYNEADWVGAVSLNEAMVRYAALTKGAVFCAFNAAFDWGFVQEAFRKTGVKNELDYHRLDILTMAWMRLYRTGQERFSLDAVAQALGLEKEPMPHAALNGALKAYEVMKKLMETKG